MGISLLILGSLAAFVGGLMIVVAAFRENMWWGLACLLIPLASIVFVILHWDDTRPWLFLNLGGLLVAVLGAAFMPSGEITLTDTVGWESSAPPSAASRDSLSQRRGRRDGQDGPRAEGRPDGGEPEGLEEPGRRDAADDEPQLLPEPERPPVRRVNPSLRPRYPTQTREEIISPTRAGQFLHRLVEITKTDGERFKGRVRAVRGDLLLVERPVGGGSITFELPMAEVQRIKVTITN